MDSSLSLHHLIIALFLVLLLVLVLIAGVITFSYLKYKSILDRKTWMQLIEGKIIQTVVEGYQPLTTDSSLTVHLQNASFRLLFIEALIASTKQFSGAALKELAKLFKELDAQGDTFQKLSKGNRIQFISDSIQGLADLSNTQILPEIEHYLNDPNPAIYLEAQYAMVQFKGFDGLSFLNQLTHLLSDWQQMRLLSSIKHVPPASTNMIYEWLRSENPTTVIFTIRLIRKFQLLEFYSAIEALQRHPVLKVRVQVVKALQALENEHTIPTLIQLFQTEEVPVQKEILKALKISKNKMSISFLKEQLIGNPSTALQVIAAEVLLELGETEFLASLRRDTSTTVATIVKHVLQDKV